MGGSALPALTLDNVHRTEEQIKAPKEDYVISYIKSLQPHQKDYLSQGRLLQSSWIDNLTPQKESRAEKTVVQGCAFATPVLRPRVEKTSSPYRITELETRAHTLHDMVPKDSKQNKRSKPHLTTLKHLNLESKDLKSCRKRVASPDVDNDHAARLAERRKRRRAKKDIVSGKKPQDCSSDTSPAKDAKKNGGKQTKRMQPGLSLMQYFSAENIGKDRLTLMPTQSGVFKKGKASVRTNVNSGSKRPLHLQDLSFKEFSFLNASRPSRKPVAGSTSSASSVSQESISFHKRPPKRHVIANLLPTKQKKEDTTRKCGSAARSSSGETRSNWDSVTWDLERELSGEQSVAVPQRHRDNQESTAILDIHDYGWGTAEKRLLDTHSSQASDRPDACLVRASHLAEPSLAPSCSISQRMLRSNILFQTLSRRRADETQPAIPPPTSFSDPLNRKAKRIANKPLQYIDDARTLFVLPSDGVGVDADESNSSSKPYAPLVTRTPSPHSHSSLTALEQAVGFQGRPKPAEASPMTEHLQTEPSHILRPSLSIDYASTTRWFPAHYETPDLSPPRNVTDVNCSMLVDGWSSSNRWYDRQPRENDGNRRDSDAEVGMYNGDHIGYPDPCTLYDEAFAECHERGDFQWGKHTYQEETNCGRSDHTAGQDLIDNDHRSRTDASEVMRQNSPDTWHSFYHPNPVNASQRRIQMSVGRELYPPIQEETVEAHVASTLRNHWYRHRLG